MPMEIFVYLYYYINLYFLLLFFLLLYLLICIAFLRFSLLLFGNNIIWKMEGFGE